MKILMTFYPLNDLGGIINNQEGLFQGLKELGHEVNVKLLVWKDRISSSKSHRPLKQEKGTMGLGFDPQHGWYWPSEKRFAYKGKGNLQRWKDYASKFDLIIWQIPVPTTHKDNRGNTDWLELYNVPVKQIAYIHDGNMLDGYPWISKVQHHFMAAAGVHPCAYKALEYLPLPRAAAFSAQINIAERIKAADKAKDRAGWFSLQTFKGWKHVDDLVRAAPYMMDVNPMILAGGGMHYYYMTSKDKMKDAYKASIAKDPDLNKKDVGKPIWDLAIAGGMKWAGWVSNAERETYLHGAKLLIDPSWSKKYAKIGEHQNRTPVDGLIGGCVPVVREWGVTDIAGKSEFYRHMENCIIIPQGVAPKEYAALIGEAADMPDKKRKEIVASGRESIVPHSDRLAVAQTFIDLANGKPAGVYKHKKDRGKHSEDMLVNGDAVFNSFFANEGGY